MSGKNKSKKDSKGAESADVATPKPECVTSMDGLTSMDNILWGMVGDTCTRSFIKDPAITDTGKQKWICFKDSKSTQKEYTYVKSETEVIFEISKATKADSGQYTFGTSSDKHATDLNMKTNITVRIIDKPESFQPSVKRNNDGINLEWNPPVTDLLVIIGYDVECRVEGETRWTKITPYKLTDCHYIDEEMSPNKVYVYRVIVYNKIGKPWISKFSDKIQIHSKTEVEPSAPRIHTPHITSVNVGDPIDLCVEVTDTCDGVTWIKDGETLKEGKVKDRKSVYKIQKATLEDAGEYTCIAKNGSKESQVKMNVLVKEVEPSAPRVHTSHITSVNVGDPIDLCVEVIDTCDGITWIKDDKQLDQGNVEDGRSVYKIPKARLEDAGEYTCIAKNDSKYSQIKMKVLVKEKRLENTLQNCMYYGFACLAVAICAIIALYLNTAGLKTDIEINRQNILRIAKPNGSTPINRQIGLNDFDEKLFLSWKTFEQHLGILETPVDPDKIQPGRPANADEIENLKRWVEEFDTTFGSLKGLKDKLEKNTDEIKNTKTWVETFKSIYGSLFGFEDKEDNLATKIDNMNIWFKHFNTTFGGLEGLKTTLVSHTTEITNLTAWVGELEETFGTVQTEVGQIKSASNEMNEIIQTKIGELQDLSTKSKKLEELLVDNTDIIGEIRKNAANRMSTQIVVVVVFIIEVGLAFWIYRIQLKIENRVGGSPSTSKTAKQVLDQVPRSVTLDRSICVIGFNNSMSNFHRSMIETAIQGLNVPFNVVVVTRHEQLTRLPHCQLYVMCTEFTERHVIIEEQGLGLGDLKRCTHDVVQKLQANLMIVYIHDPGSRSLPQGQLFNTRIPCVSSQPELMRLRDRNMFYSIYDRLTESQISAFRDSVNSCVQRR